MLLDYRYISTLMLYLSLLLVKRNSWSGLSSALIWQFCQNHCKRRILWSFLTISYGRLQALYPYESSFYHAERNKNLVITTSNISPFAFQQIFQILRLLWLIPAEPAAGSEQRSQKHCKRTQATSCRHHGIMGYQTAETFHIFIRVPITAPEKRCLKQ